MKQAAQPDSPLTASRKSSPLSALPPIGRFIAALAIAVIAGLVRGFSGFGSALIYMPLISAIYGPRVAAPTLLLIDTICSLAVHDPRDAAMQRREVAGSRSPASLVSAARRDGAGLYRPLILLRWFIVALVLVALAALVSGWRYHGKPTMPASLATGAVAGFGGGAVQIAAPPLLVFWLGGANKAATVRANIMVYFLHAGRAGDGHVLLERRCSPARRSHCRSCSACRLRWRWRSASTRFTARARRSTGASPTSSSRLPASVSMPVFDALQYEHYALIFCTSASDTSKLA